MLQDRDDEPLLLYIGNRCGGQGRDLCKKQVVGHIFLERREMAGAELEFCT
jgi:hypothetical protein